MPITQSIFPSAPAPGSQSFSASMAWSWVCRVLRSTSTWPRCSSRLWTHHFTSWAFWPPNHLAANVPEQPPCCRQGSSLWPVPQYPWVSTAPFQLPSSSFPKPGSQSGPSQLPRGCENLKAPPNLSQHVITTSFPSRSHIPPHHDGRDRKRLFDWLHKLPPYVHGRAVPHSNEVSGGVGEES